MFALTSLKKHETGMWADVLHHPVPFCTTTVCSSAQLPADTCITQITLTLTRKSKVVTQELQHGATRLPQRTPHGPDKLKDSASKSGRNAHSSGKGGTILCFTHKLAAMQTQAEADPGAEKSSFWLHMDADSIIPSPDLASIKETTTDSANDTLDSPGDEQPTLGEILWAVNKCTALVQSVKV